MESDTTEIETAIPDKVPPPAGRKMKESHKTALFISGIALAGLLGIMVGMFMAADKSPAQTPQTSDAEHKTAIWLAQTPPTADSDNNAAEIGDPLPEETDMPPQPEPVTAPHTDASVAGIHDGTLKSGQAVVTALTDLGLTAADAQLIINSLDGVFDFRRAKPGDHFTVQFDSQTGRPASFRYEASKTDIYLVQQKGESFKGHKLNIVPDRSMRIFAGTITSSLFGTLKDLGAKAALAGKVADILSTQVNFLKEQRPGDTFKVMVEEESLNGEYLGYGPVLALEYNGIKAGQRRLFRYEENQRNPSYYDEKLISTPSSALTIPLYYSRMSSPFGWRIHPVLKRKKLHNGVDFSAPTGTPVWACADGKIIISGNKGPNGNLVGIEHSDGLSSFYAHLHHIEKGISNGVSVKRKQVIGYVGSTGRSTGPHLHWGVKQNGKFIDPLKYKVIPGRKVAAAAMADLKKVIASRKAQLDKTPIEAPKGELEQVPEDDFPLGNDDL